VNNPTHRPELSPTARWLAAAPHLPKLHGPEHTAERLLLLTHYGVDWDGGWVARYRTTYWDRILPDRVIAATWRADTLRKWWREVTMELDSSPRNKPERLETELLLCETDLPVLQVLRFETEPLLLRTRIVTEAVREARAATTKLEVLL
jgi:hypothetical protein